MAKQAYIALLRGINVGGHNKLSMAQLREIAGGLGWQQAETYIQSGNLIFKSTQARVKLESVLEGALKAQLGLTVASVVRSLGEWEETVRLNPMPEASEAAPARVMLALSKQTLPEGVEVGLAPYCRNGEKVMVMGDALWLHFAVGSGSSKLTPAVLDRVCGSPVTTRNWRTVQKIGALLRK